MSRNHSYVSKDTRTLARFSIHKRHKRTAKGNTTKGMLGKMQRLVLGISILILVDVVWVSSKELPKFLYRDKSFEKPFFSTYFKSSMFTIYLIIIGLTVPWKESCDKKNGNYSMMDQTADDENYYSNQGSLSDPTFIPIRPGCSSGAISGTESDDSSIRSVRFSKLAEVREMSASEATEALMSRLSYAASMRIRRQKSHHKTAKAALAFCLMWFIANYLLQLSLEMDDTAMVTVLSSLSSFFTLAMAAFFPSASGDKFTITKIIAVLMNIGGVITMTITDLQDVKISRCVLPAIFAAFFCAAYLVFAKRKSDMEEKIDIPLFFGFIGLWSLFLMWPIFFILNFLQIEKFELPTQNQFTILFMSGLIGTVISEALWLWGCFLTSSLMGTMAMSLQVPLSIVFDVLLKRKEYTPMLHMGAVPIFTSLLMVAVLIRNDDSDPLMKLFKAIYRRLCRCEKPGVIRISDEEQQESLIGNND